MKRKYYTAPSAELIMLMPAEEIAFTWKWNWGTYTGGSTASVAGNLSIFTDENDDSWIYKGSDKPY